MGYALTPSQPAARLRTFEVRVLRPIHVALILGAIFAGFNGRWWWVGGCVVGMLYVGAVGARLHPLQSARDLANGPLDNPVAAIEASSLSAEDVYWILSTAIRKVSFLVGVVTGALLLSEAHWRWYAAVPLAVVVALIHRVALTAGFARGEVSGEGS